MKFAKSIVTGTGAVVLAGLILALLVPKAAHAIAATLVQVANTAANPAITQSTKTQAAQLVELVSVANGGNSNSFSQVTVTGYQLGSYSVPPTQNLVVTSADITPSPGCGATTAVYLNQASYFRGYWVVSGLATTHLAFPSGIALAPASTLSFQNVSSAGCSAYVDLQGYLTAN
jgi:hypothetical protein